MRHAGGKLMSTEKSNHRSQIYRYLFHHERVSQQDIAQDLGLSMPTVTSCLNSLRSAGLICDAGNFESTGGRKARALRIVPDARLAIGLDITENHISLVVIDMKAHILHSNRIRLHFADSLFYYSTVGKLLEHFIRESGAESAMILGLGVCTAAIIEEDHRTVRSGKLFGIPGNLFEKLQPYIHLPFLLFNDANSSGFAEWWDLETEKTIIYLSLSNSVGGAMVANRRLYVGDNGRSCEFGHATLVPDGRLCYCGQKGCTNAYLNARLLANLAGGKMDQFFRNVECGAEPCRSAFQEYLHYLAVAVNNLRMNYDCDIVLGGYVGSYMTPYLDDFREMVQSRNRFRDDGSFIRACRHRYEAAAIGAALFYIDRFIQAI